jgi:uncharacterized membrane protein
MDLASAFGQLNWWAVLLATLSSFVVGFTWYHLKVFGRQWMLLNKLSEKQIQRGGSGVYILTTISALFTAILTGSLMIALGISGILNGLLFGLILGAVFRLGSHTMHNGFAQRSNALTAIDGGHDIVALSIMGAILGIWI